MKIKTTTLVIAALLAMAGAATAQIGDDRVHTWIEITEPEPIQDWDGNTTVTRTIEVRLCYEEGATNPAMQSFTVNITVNNHPDWVNVSHPESISLTPPVGPTGEAGCTEPTTFDVEIHTRTTATDTEGTGGDNGTGDDTTGTETQPDAAPHRSSFNLQVTLTPSASEDPVSGEPGVGTYDVPAEESVTFDVRTQDDPETVPGPAVIVVLIATMSLLALRRKKQ